MAKHLDLEEQEQLDQIKHFWARWGNLITWVLIIVFGSVAAWNGWNYWQRNQAMKAAAVYDEVERAALARDTERLTRTLNDMQAGFGRTAFASQAGLLAAQAFQDAGKPDDARAALTWVSEKQATMATRWWHASVWQHFGWTPENTNRPWPCWQDPFLPPSRAWWPIAAVTS
jgi:predicted negative regulator of RcsB-dependent stress response